MSKTGFNKKSLAKFAANAPENFRLPTMEIERRLLAEYGALFVARGGAIAPEQVIFKDESEVSDFQARVEKSSIKIGDFKVELQTAALEKLKDALFDAEKDNLTITPRAADSARRSYRNTVDLWASRVNPALDFWTKEGKLSERDAEKIRALSPRKQIATVLKLEESEIFFSKDLKKSILYSVAPPGASQHLSMLALDVNEYNDERVRKILAKHFWHQTVVSDLPHFTFLGAAESDLPELNLKRTQTADGRVFWTPDVE